VLQSIGVTATAVELNTMDGITSTTAELNVLDGITATTTELNYLDGVTSSVQTQLDAKAAATSPTITTDATISGTTPTLYLEETDIPATWRVRVVSDQLRLYSNTAANDRFTFDTTGNFVADANITAYSDARLKENLEVITDAVAKVKALTGYTYDRTDLAVRQTGVIAQDVQKVLPEAVMANGKYLSVAYGNMVGLLIEAIKEQQAQIDELKSRLES